jgi:hypothetical protein
MNQVTDSCEMQLTDEQLERCALGSGLDEELWFGRFTPKGYTDAMPKLRKFAELVRAAGKAVTDSCEVTEAKRQEGENHG